MQVKQAASIGSSIALAIGLGGYPIAAYFALTHLSPRAAAAALLIAFVPAAIVRARRRPGHATPPSIGPLLWLPALTVGLLLGSAALGSAGLVRGVPVLINATLLFAFATTLWQGPPMIERFARMQVDDLQPAELRWCRGWTWGWSALFAFNGGMALWLGLTSKMEAWAIYNGMIAYILVGMMLGVEYCVRKFRFGRLGPHVVDRILGQIFARIDHHRR